MFAFQDVAGGLLATVNSKITCLPQGLLKCEIDRSIAPPLRTHTYYINKSNTKRGSKQRKGQRKGNIIRILRVSTKTIQGFQMLTTSPARGLFSGSFSVVAMKTAIATL